MEPTRELSSIQVVRNSLSLLASRHPTISADKVAYLPDDLLNWDKLVKVDFVAEWEQAAREQIQKNDPLDLNFGNERLSYVSGPATLQRMYDRAKKDADAFGVLQCAFIMVGNLIEDQIHRSHPELARTIQLQINSFWNASANKAFIESGLGNQGVIAVLPEYDPMPPELKGAD
jgi:hypothetical protein